jgi:hypothetical protein
MNMNDINPKWIEMNPEEAIAFFTNLERENAALRADKERLDWLQKNEWYWNWKRRNLRKAIDRCRADPELEYQDA